MQQQYCTFYSFVPVGRQFTANKYNLELMAAIPANEVAGNSNKQQAFWQQVAAMIKFQSANSKRRATATHGKVLK